MTGLYNDRSEIVDDVNIDLGGELVVTEKLYKLFINFPNYFNGGVLMYSFSYFLFTTSMFRG